MSRKLLASIAVITSTLYCFTATAQTCKSNIAPNVTSAQYIDTGEGYVIDVKTGLMWSKCSFGQTFNDGGCTGSPANLSSWSAALMTTETVNSDNYLGFQDWRLPNAKELASLVSYQCMRPAINVELFPDTPSAAYWTNTPNAESAMLGSIARIGRIVDFSLGLDVLPQTNPNIYVRHVRPAGF